MKIALLNDTSNHINWGCKATTGNLKTILQNRFAGAKFEFRHNPNLPWGMVKTYQNYLNRALLNHLSAEKDNETELHKQLLNLNFPDLSLPLADRIYLNGEGMLHDNSGHLPRLIGTLLHYKHRGSWVGVINQTVDLQENAPALRILSDIYNKLDHITVRDPRSLEILKNAGVNNCQLVPDAAFLCRAPEIGKIEKARREFALPDRYIAITGSSSLKPHSVDVLLSVYRTVQEITSLPIVLLGNTKTDHRLMKRIHVMNPDSILVDNSACFETAIAVISGAETFVSGRFHPMIFAAVAGTPIVPLGANTHKNNGLMEMLDYPIATIGWNDMEALTRALVYIGNNRAALNKNLIKRAELLRNSLEKVAG